MGGDLNAMSRGARRVIAGARECLRARFEHPYRTFALGCLTLPLAKSIPEHPYRTFAPLRLTIALAKSISERPYHTSAPLRLTLALAKSISEHPYRTFCLSNGGRS